MSELSTLIERLEAAKSGGWELDFAIEQALGEWTNLGGGYRRHKATGVEERYNYTRGADPVTSSVDAVLALVERLIPDAKVFLCNWPGGSRAWAARLVRDGDDARAPTPALAICLALLRALEGRELSPVAGCADALSPLPRGQAGVAATDGEVAK